MPNPNIYGFAHEAPGSDSVRQLEKMHQAAQLVNDDLERYNRALADRRQDEAKRRQEEFARKQLEVDRNFKTITDKVQIFGTFSARAFTIGTASLTGFVAAGLAGTTQGGLLTLQMQMLSREIASVFKPVIDATI